MAGPVDPGLGLECSVLLDITSDLLFRAFGRAGLQGCLSTVPCASTSRGLATALSLHGKPLNGGFILPVESEGEFE